MMISEKYRRLPQYVNPRQLSTKGKTLTRSVDVSIWNRVKDAVKEIRRTIEASLDFYLEEKKVAVLGPENSQRKKKRKIKNIIRG